MDPEKILKLIDAGFTADEIRKMVSPDKTESGNPEPKKEEPKKEEPKKVEPEEPKKEDPAGKYIEDLISGINKKVDEITGAIDKISKISLFPAMEKVEPRGIDDVIDKFFENK